MKTYIINAPQLQSIQKRLGGFFSWLLCWAMWIYLLVPLVTLTSWVLGDKKMINDAILEGLEIDFNFSSWDKEGKIILLFR